MQNLLLSNHRRQISYGRGMQSKLKNTLRNRYYRSETSSNNVSQSNLNWPGENASGISTVS